MSGESDPEAAARRRRWAVAAMRVLGLALLVLVLASVHLRDSVTLRDGTRLPGEILDARLPTKAQWDAGAAVRVRLADDREESFTRERLAIEKATDVPEVDEGLLRIVRGSDKLLLVLALGLMGLVTQIGVLRWWLLLRAQDIRLSFVQANRLTFIGFFFNNVVPGPTGGDVVKALYAARRTDKTAQAIVTVAIDRIAGIIALALIAAAVLVTKLDDERYRDLAVFIGLFLAGIAVAATLFFSRTVRRVTRVESWSARLPGGALIRKADEALLLWRGHKRALLVALALSFANQLSIQGLMLIYARALSTPDLDALPWTAYMAILPVGLIVSALPVLPGGWGVREAAFAYCFAKVGVARNPAIALSVLNGATMLFWSLLGGIFFLTDRGAARASGVEALPELTVPD